MSTIEIVDFVLKVALYVLMGGNIYLSRQADKVGEHAASIKSLLWAVLCMAMVINLGV